jgi:CobQ-like glutamine amidotransferase family enzyme/UDP-N-acetylmuramyl tripeptide synthase
MEQLCALRLRLAVIAGASLGALSRAMGKGSGSVVGGHAILALEPRALARLSAGRRVALVSGTNGKTTTTKFLVTALGAVSGQEVASNVAGANLPTGLAVALARAQPGAPAVLEVDEAWLAHVAAEVQPAVLALLNLSRDQLDRNNEVRQVAERWRQATAALGEGAAVVANADDPLVAWAALAARRVVWVGAGLAWRGDANGCPRCGGQIFFGEREGWHCSSCALARPEPELWLEPGTEGHWLAAQRSAQGSAETQASHVVDLRLPGRANAANALMALATLQVLVSGTPACPPGARQEDLTKRALASMAAVEEVAGRYAVLEFEGASARLLLAKNPAGWEEVFAMLRPWPRPVVVAINARTADGHDPSWLWDVPFERLRGRRVVATGERCLDLAVRLHYGGVGHVTEPCLKRALAKAGPGEVDVVANYTAFHQFLAGARQPAKRSRNARVGGGLNRDCRGGNGLSGPVPRGQADEPAREGLAPSATLAPTASAQGRLHQAKVRGQDSKVTIALVYPDLLGTYGDAGNATVLAQRLAWRGIAAEVLQVSFGQAVPEGCELYVLGGGEDLPQVLAAQTLRQSRALSRAVQKGAVVLAICAGLQVLGESFPAPRTAGGGKGVAQDDLADGGQGAGGQVGGVGLLPCVTYRTGAPRAIGEVLVSASGRWRELGLLTGFENHASVTDFLPGAEPAGKVLVGTGNKDGTSEGVVCGRIWGTYLHGPVLARNPRLADLLLSWSVGELQALDDSEPGALHAERASRGPWERRQQEVSRRWASGNARR